MGNDVVRALVREVLTEAVLEDLTPGTWVVVRGNGWDADRPWQVVGYDMKLGKHKLERPSLGGTSTTYQAVEDIVDVLEADDPRVVKMLAYFDRENEKMTQALSRDARATFGT